MSNDEQITPVIAKVPREYISIITAEQRCNGYVTIKEIEEAMVQHFESHENWENQTVKMDKVKNHPKKKM